MENGSKNWLVIRLGIPLLFLFGVSMVGHQLIDADGFFLNLATELVGIGVTIVYVDRVLRRHEAEQWGSTRSLIDGRIRLAANRGLTGVRSALGFDDLRELDPRDEVLSASQYRTALRRVVLPQVPTRIRNLTQDGWKDLASTLRETASDADLILRTLGSRLSPNEYSALLNLQDQVRLALLSYDITPEHYGTDVTISSPADIVAHDYHTRTAIPEIQAVLDQILQLGDLVPDEPSQRRALNS